MRDLVSLNPKSWSRPVPISSERLRIIGLATLGASALVALPATAQVTPSDVRDLVGARAASGESELASRGYVNVGGQTGADRKWTYWWNDRRGLCLTVSTVEGRYDSLVSTPNADCQQRADQGFSPPPFGYGGPGRDDYREHIALICYGQGDKLTTQPQTGYQWDDEKRKYVPKSGYELTHQDYSTSVTIEIDGERGRIRPAKNMLPPLRSGGDDGWYDLANLSISRDFIRGEFRLNGANKPKMTIDRRAGHISLDGLTKFSGTCTPLDADRKF